MTRRMVRHKDWRGRLVGYVQEMASQPFRPGKLDCALFSAGAVRVISLEGLDPARGYRSAYRSLKAARKVLAERGFASHVDVAAYYFDEIAPIMAQPGDLAVVSGDMDEALGVVQGEFIWVLMPSGLGSVPLTAAKRAFAV